MELDIRVTAKKTEGGGNRFTHFQVTFDYPELPPDYQAKLKAQVERGCTISNTLIQGAAIEIGSKAHPEGENAFGLAQTKYLKAILRGRKPISGCLPQTVDGLVHRPPCIDRWSPIRPNPAWIWLDLGPYRRLDRRLDPWLDRRLDPWLDLWLDPWVVSWQRREGSNEQDRAG